MLTLRRRLSKCITHFTLQKIYLIITQWQNDVFRRKIKPIRSSFFTILMHFRNANTFSYFTWLLYIPCCSLLRSVSISDIHRIIHAPRIPRVTVSNRSGRTFSSESYNLSNIVDRPRSRQRVDHYNNIWYRLGHS